MPRLAPFGQPKGGQDETEMGPKTDQIEDQNETGDGNPIAPASEPPRQQSATQSGADSVEGQQNGFDNIPKSIYWSVVTLTTVGYGDVVPVTALGKLIASVIMIMGYGIIAVPTGIVSADMARHSSKSVSTQACRSCSKDGHDVDATHCKFCGEQLNE